MSNQKYSQSTAGIITQLEAVLLTAKRITVKMYQQRKDCSANVLTESIAIRRKIAMQLFC